MGGGGSTPSSPSPPVFTGTCGTYKADAPTLGIYVEDTLNAAADAKVVARVLTDAAGWTDWKALSYSQCDPYQAGKRDYFDDFESLTDPWLAVALYNCDTDGIDIGGLEYWDGSSNQQLEYFCDNVAGPSVECYSGAVTPGQGRCYGSSTDNYYEGVWIDQDVSYTNDGNKAGCPGINVATGLTTTGIKKSKRVNVGGLYYKSNPGIPNCGSLYPKASFMDSLLSVEQNGSVSVLGQSASMEMILIICALLMMFVWMFRSCWSKMQGGKQLTSPSGEYQALNTRANTNSV